MRTLTRPRSFAAAAAALFLACAAVAAQQPSTPSPDPSAQAAQILARRCLSCHNGEKKTAGVDLSTQGGALAAGAGNGDDPPRNRVVRMVAAGKMPPSGRLPAQEIAALRRWAKAGAPYPHEPLEAMKVSDQPLWSLDPIRRPAPPRTPFDALAKNPIDRFFFARLAAKGLRPSPPASRRELIR